MCTAAEIPAYLRTLCLAGPSDTGLLKALAAAVHDERVLPPDAAALRLAEVTLLRLPDMEPAVAASWVLTLLFRWGERGGGDGSGGQLGAHTTVYVWGLSGGGLLCCYRGVVHCTEAGSRLCGAIEGPCVGSQVMYFTEVASVVTQAINGG